MYDDDDREDLPPEAAAAQVIAEAQAWGVLRFIALAPVVSDSVTFGLRLAGYCLPSAPVVFEVQSVCT